MSELPSSSGNVGTIAEAPKGGSAEDINAYLKADFPPVPDPKPAEPEEKVEPDVEDVELKEPDEKIKLDEEDEDEKSKEEDEEAEEKDTEPDIELDAPPKKKEILAKYPTIFKDFPWFEKMMYRDRQYTELFGSYDDAKEAAEQVEVLSHFENDLMSGKTETILAKVKELDKRAFDKLVDNYLPTLAKVDKEAYLEVVGSVSKRIIEEMVYESRNIGASNQEASNTLKQAALIVNQFLFGSSEYKPYKPRVEPQAEREESQVNQERLSYVRERFEDVRNDLQGKVDKILRSTISEYIDPRNEMSPYVKKHAVRDALSGLHATIGEDKIFRKNLDKLWDHVFSTRFSKDAQSRVQKTYLGKAKSHLKDVIRKARAEALKGKPSHTSDGDSEIQEKERPKRGPIASGRPHQSSGKMGMKKGESVYDFLSRD